MSLALQKTENFNPTIKDILKDSNYSLEQFTDSEIAFLENKIFLKNDKPHIVCLVRDKDIQIKPEEIIRQLYIAKLINHYGYEKQYIKCEYTITFGREKNLPILWCWIMNIKIANILLSKLKNQN